jgi:hypothetical protein
VDSSTSGGEQVRDYCRDVAKWRIAGRKWDFSIAYDNWKQGNTMIFPGPLTDDDFHKLDRWLQNEIIKDNPLRYCVM